MNSTPKINVRYRDENGNIIRLEEVAEINDPALAITAYTALIALIVYGACTLLGIPVTFTF